MLPDTPLVNAIRKNDWQTAENLIDSGETIPSDLMDYDRTQLYDLLVRNKGYRVIDLLADKGFIGTDVYEYDSFKRSFFESLFKYIGNEEPGLQFLSEFIGRLDNASDEVEGENLLSFAIENKVPPAVLKTLIDSGIRTDFRKNSEDNLINQVVRINMMQPELQNAYVQLLLDAGIDLNEPNVVNQAALHIAVETNKPHLLEILLKNGAQPNLQDKKGNSAYYYAVAHKFDLKTYLALSEVEAPDFTQRNRDDQTMLSEFIRVMQGGNSEMQLLERMVDDGASLDDAAPYYSQPKTGWDWIVEKPTEYMEMLLKKTGRDVNAQDNDGNTLLHKVCAINPNYSHETAKQLYKKAKLLLSLGADPSITNTKDETAEQLASSDNLKAKLVELLLTSKK